MFCSKENMFGMKNIANILGAPKDVVSGGSENRFPTAAKENAEVSTKVPTSSPPPFSMQSIQLVPTVFSLPDDTSEAKDYVDIPFVDVETEELRRELASARQVLKDVHEELATEKVDKLKIQEELGVVQAKKDKVVKNLRSKRSLLLQVQARNIKLDKQLACEKSEHKVATDEIESLTAGLLSVSASREDLKQKLKSRQESIKQARAEQEDLESKLAKIEGRHDTENELLTLFRKLACHTGYFKWGKQIRVLESKLADAAEEAAAAAAAARDNAGDGNRSHCHKDH
jgi:DNA repair exonuclease SbcCD ATPase subunit